MDAALRLARAAGRRGEVPIGAVVIAGGRPIGRGANHPIGAHDPTAHAEISALRRAGRSAGNYRLPGATLYVTLEPCLMCLGAMVHARIDRLVFGAPDRKIGATSLLKRARRGLNHRFDVRGGVMEEECAGALWDFFRARRVTAARRAARNGRDRAGDPRTPRRHGRRAQRPA